MPFESENSLLGRSAKHSIIKRTQNNSEGDSIAYDWIECETWDTVYCIFGNFLWTVYCIFYVSLWTIKFFIEWLIDSLIDWLIHW